MSLEQEFDKEIEMSFLDHLEVLRWHLIRSILAIFIGGMLLFINKNLLFDTIIFGPKKGDFITYRLLCKCSAWLSKKFPSLVDNTTLCIGQNLPELQNLTMSGQFTAHILISIVAGLILAFPYVIYELWKFILPGLSKSERKNAKGFIFFTSLLFLLGVLFSYFIIAPLSIHFFLNYQVSDSVANIPQLSSYTGILVNLTLGCGLLFELPILIYFLAKSGVVSAQMLASGRKLALVGCLLLSAVITPPDVFSQILVTGPLMILYEVGIKIAKRVELKIVK